jgi:hypothetical protein
MTELTEDEQYDVVFAALGDEWRSEEEIASAVKTFDLLFCAARESGIEFEGIKNPEQTLRKMLHSLRTGKATLIVDGDCGDVLIFGEGKRVNLSQIRMRRKPRPA